jgi:hypothetical protein
MDIRDPTIHERKIRLIYPRFFYHKCSVCGFEFRRTTMWSWIDSWYEDGCYLAYACMSCVPDYKDVFKHISGFKPAPKAKE